MAFIIKKLFLRKGIGYFLACKTYFKPNYLLRMKVKFLAIAVVMIAMVSCGNTGKEKKECGDAKHAETEAVEEVAPAVDTVAVADTAVVEEEAAH